MIRVPRLSFPGGAFFFPWNLILRSCAACFGAVHDFVLLHEARPGLRVKFGAEVARAFGDPLPLCGFLQERPSGAEGLLLGLVFHRHAVVSGRSFYLAHAMCLCLCFVCPGVFVFTRIVYAVVFAVFFTDSVKLILTRVLFDCAGLLYLNQASSNIFFRRIAKIR